MTWADLFASASPFDGGAQFVLDGALSALAASRDPILKATVVAATPSARELCRLLDFYRVPVPGGLDPLAYGDDAIIAAARIDPLEDRTSLSP